MPDLFDKRLVLRLKMDDGIAFEKLFHKYNQKLFNFAYKMLRSRAEAECIVQSTFTKIWEMRSGLDESHSFNGYLFKIAQNDIYNLFRKGINEKYYQEYFLEYAEKLECSLEDKINYNELVEIIDQLIEELPDRRKLIFSLSRKDGLTYREIADKLDISENTVDTQIRKALDYIRQHLRIKYFSLTR